MTGGGSFPQPGEISLAHNGILYLDELPEYSRNVLEVLRQPLEDRKITVSRIRCNVEYPASFMPVSYTHLRAHETGRNLVCRLLLEKKKKQEKKQQQKQKNKKTKTKTDTHNTNTKNIMKTK